MRTLFDPTDLDSIVTRLRELQPANTRLWGKMNGSQMMSHCSAVLETAVGITPRRQALLGRIITPFIRSAVLGEKPFGRNSPTDPKFVMSDERDFEAERKRLLDLIALFVSRGPDQAGRATHSFFGKLTGAEWGVLSYKHLDHHLRQFGR
jgi:hypothetical protein